MATEKRITAEEAAAAEERLDNHEAWIDMDRGDEMCLDGWFSVSDLEAIILLKRYKDQQGS